MSKIKAPSANSKGGDADPAPPRGLSKAEKSDFRRVCDLRRQAGNPVQPIESDLVADYVQTRSRLALWQKKLRHGQVFERETFTGYPKGERMDLAEQLSLAATLDRTAAACRRLARDLQLIGQSHG